MTTAKCATCQRPCDDATICTACAGACPGSCNAEFRRDPVNVVPSPGEPVWCNRCRTAIRHALHAVPELYAHLALDKHRATRTAGEKLGKHGKGAAAPSPSAAADEQDALVHLLTYWEDAIREDLELRVRPARFGTTSEYGAASQEIATLNGTCQFLNSHIDWALQHPGHALELGRDILRVTARVRQMTKTNAQRRRMPIPCPRCEYRTLTHEGGQDHIVCGNPDCNRYLSMDEYAELAVELARRRPKRVTA